MLQSYVSFIGFARNDHYVPDRTQRHNFSLNFLLQQLKDFQIQRGVEPLLRRLGISTLCHSLFNYPKRKFLYAKGGIFDSYEQNFIKTARRWAKNIPPFYLNDPEWGLVNENLHMETLCLKQPR